MAPQTEIVSRLKKWIKSNKEKNKTIESGGKEQRVSTESAIPNLQSLSKKEKAAELEKLTSEQSDLIVELSDKLVDTVIKLQGCSLQSKHLAAQNIVKNHMASGGAMALLPIPIFDFASLAGTQVSLVKKLAQHYDVKFDEKTAKTVLVSLFSGAIPLVTVVGLSSVAKIIPGIGSIGGGISMSMLSGALIYAVGQVFIKHFEQGGTLENFDSTQWISSFKQSFEAQRALKH